MHVLTVLACALVLSRPLASEDPANIGDHFARGAPTFVIGTLGGERNERATRAQARLVRDVLFPAAEIVRDVDVDAAKGVEAWPAVPVLYGGAHVNALLAQLAPELPFRVTAGVIEIGNERFEGAEHRLIAMVPSGRTWPAFALYAGAGTPGVEEINVVQDRGAGFVVADRFGVLVLGHFERDEAGAVRARIAGRSRRLPWREASVELEGFSARATVHRLQLDAVTEQQSAEDAAIARGLVRALRGLELGAAELEVGVVIVPVVHVYPDQGSKRSLARDGGDGYADLPSKSLHVVRFEPAVLEALIAHEAVHVLASDLVGAAGSALFGEGLAVWVAGSYGGRSLDEWRVSPPAAAAELAPLELAGSGWRTLPEEAAYPAAGLVVGALVDAVGLDAFLAHLYSAPPAELEAAAIAAGLEEGRLTSLFAAALDGED